MEKLKNPKLSIIIPVYNEEKDIGNCLKSLGKQSYSNFEIIIVDDGSTDKTLDIVKKYGVRILKQNHKGPGEARNLGAKNAKGEILILVDADMTFHKDYLKNLIKPILENKTIGTEEEFQFATNLDNLWSRCYGKYRTNPKAKEGKIFRAILKSEFLKMGGFDAKYGYADDQTFLYKYGVKSKVAKDAKCYHNNPETARETFKQSVWMGASNNSFWFKIPILNLSIVILMFFFSPLLIFLLTLRKKYFKVRNRAKNEKFWSVFLFISVRYFGTIKGLLRRIFLGKNTR